ncbi:hypothetical protein NCCP2716_25920 [Sporosarcina sp. NCCP-2716]|uniref:NUDIX domain-containing protein n=1 Tax=Sporosarcina sp. NCCP-2716 TaxID=2943679 RepID=UPI0020862172|nr:NUDIX domain-containing protein [Sporosarcina sp. NCCP-2716]GKV70094.1 hypothetical protein NCCP2716_25920 [Sporosarcina sp. NCCP-2716]
MNYIKDMRKLIGQETLFTVGCGVLIEQQGKILLQHRTDEDNWCIPGGVMELGETFEEAAIQGALEEAKKHAQNVNTFYAGFNFV